MNITLQEFAGLAAGILSAVAYVLYFRATIKGTTKPNRVTWCLLTLIGFIILVSSYSTGARETLGVAWAYFLGPLAIAILSFKRGEVEWTWIERGCLLGSIAGAILWIVTDSPMTALLINIAMDFLALTPTIQKSYLEPQYEDKTAWSLEALASLVNLVAVTPWIFSIWVYPVYLAVMNGLIAALLVYGMWKRGK